MKRAAAVLLLVLVAGVVATRSRAEIYKGEPLASEHKSDSLAKYVAGLLVNAEKYSDLISISQEEIGSLGYYLHYYSFNYREIFDAKRVFAAEGINGPSGMSPTQVMEGEKLFSDLLWIRSRMDHYERYDGLRCTFAYGALMERAIRNSIFNNHAMFIFPENSPGLEFLNDDSGDKRQTIGLCYRPDDYWER